ncbi:MAG: hypothetical protein ACYCZJ_05480 [Sulfuriferula sp.]
MKSITAIGAFVLVALSGCAVVSPPVQPAQPNAASAQNSFAQTVYWQNVRSYMVGIESIEGHSLREVRVEQESRAMKKAGKPVPLPTGSCMAIVTITREGVIEAVHPGQCASDELANTVRAAILRTSPLPPAPFPGNAPRGNITVVVSAPVATPGVNGN